MVVQNQPIVHNPPDLIVPNKQVFSDHPDFDQLQANWLAIQRHGHPLPATVTILRPAIKVRSHLQSLVSGTLTLVTFDTVVHTGTDASEPTLATDVVTVNLNGIYHMTFTGYFDTLDPSTFRLIARLDHNGAAIEDANRIQTWQGDGTALTDNAIVDITASTDVACSSGDTLSVKVEHANATPANANLRLSFLSIHYVAPWSP